MMIPRAVRAGKKEGRIRSVTRRAVTSLSLQAQVSEGEDGRSPLLCEILRFTLKPAISLSRGEQLGISGSRDDPKVCRRPRETLIYPFGEAAGKREGEDQDPGDPRCPKARVAHP